MHSKRITVTPAAFIGAILSLAGCASVTGPVEYPAMWPPLESVLTVDGCPNLAGTYSNRGSEASPPELGDPPDLSEVFARMGHGIGPLTIAASASIEQTPETLSVTFVGENQEQTLLRFRRYHFKWNEERFDDLFTCYVSESGSRLRFLAEPESHSEAIPYFYMGGGGTLVMLLKAVDGSLIVQWRSDSVGLSILLLGSHISFKSVWWRYPPLANVR